MAIFNRQATQVSQYFLDAATNNARLTLRDLSEYAAFSMRLLEVNNQSALFQIGVVDSRNHEWLIKWGEVWLDIGTNLSIAAPFFKVDIMEAVHFKVV